MDIPIEEVEIGDIVIVRPGKGTAGRKDCGRAFLRMVHATYETYSDKQIGIWSGATINKSVPLSWLPIGKEPFAQIIKCGRC